MDIQTERDEYVRLMGLELGQVYHELQTDFESLVILWMEHQELFRKGQDRIDLLNLVSSNFFYLVSSVMYETAMLHLCRITDRPEVHGNEILTLKRLPDLISDSRLKTVVQTKVDEAWARCEFARLWRNRALAHTNLQTFRRVAAPLPAVAAEHVDDALQAISDIFGAIGNHYALTHSLLMLSPWGSRALIGYLEHCKKLRDQEEAGWRKT
jgi:AbiU2